MGIMDIGVLMGLMYVITHRLHRPHWYQKTHGLTDLVSLRSLTLLMHMGLVDFMGLFGLMNLRVAGGSYGYSWSPRSSYSC
jgi:hypothetical protein